MTKTPKQNNKNARRKGKTPQIVLALTPFVLAGCAALKKGAVVGLAGGVGAGTGALLSGGALAPVAGAAVAAGLTSTTLNLTGESGMDCAPDNFFTLVSKLIEIGGWFLLILVVAPMMIGWFLPRPLESKKE